MLSLMKGIYPNSFHWGMLSNNWSANKMNSSCEMKSTGHEFLNTHYKNHSRYIIPSKTNHNHQRDQHGYQRNQKKKKNHQEHVWQKILGAKKIWQFQEINLIR